MVPLKVVPLEWPEERLAEQLSASASPMEEMAMEAEIKQVPVNVQAVISVVPVAGK